MYTGGDLGLVPEGPGTRNAVHIAAVPCPNWPIKDLHPPLGTKLAVYRNSGETIGCSVSYSAFTGQVLVPGGGSRYLPPPPSTNEYWYSWGPSAPSNYLR